MQDIIFRSRYRKPLRVPLSIFCPGLFPCPEAHLNARRRTRYNATVPHKELTGRGVYEMIVSQVAKTSVNQ
jgi:hypothetical protein